MKHLLFAACLSAAAAGGLAAGSAEVHYFRARLFATNEVPPVNYAGSGVATLLVHVVRDENGQVESGSVDFHVAARIPAAATLTGWHIHRGAAGENGPVVIDSTLTSTPVPGPGDITLSRQGQVMATNTNAVAALRDMLQNPAGYYVNLHTTEFPAGAIRGQVERAEMVALGTVMSARNEVPALPAAAGSGAGAVVVLATRDASGNVTGGSALLVTNYSLSEQSTLTGFHIHEAPAGVNGPVVINSFIPPSLATPSTGSGVVTSVGAAGGFVEIDMGNANQARALNGLLTSPGNYYLNLHSTAYPAGVIRGQLRRLETLNFSLEASPANEVPAITDYDARAIAHFAMGVLRAEDGSVELAHWLFSANYRFPGMVTLTGMHVHEGAAGANGPVRFDSGLPRTDSTASGHGNIFFIAPPVAAGVAKEAADRLVSAPDAFYFNLHTSTYPGGATRGQLLGDIGDPVITAVVPGNLVSQGAAVAPGQLITIFGRNLAKSTGSLNSWQGRMIPDGLNGAAVAVGDRRAPLLYVSPTQINAQVPFDVTPGEQLVRVHNGKSVSGPQSVQVAAAAPALFVGPSGVLAVRAADFSLVTTASPAATGETVLVFSTGLGQTTPPLASGQIVPISGFFNTTAVTLTVGGQPVQILGSAALPGFVGVYATGFNVPAGLGAGDHPVVLRAGTASSNSATLPVR